MAQTTVDDVLTDAQVILGDTSGAITQTLWTYFSLVYGELIAMLLKLNAQEVVREVYYTLPAYTNVIFPESLGVTDFAEPQQLWERGAVDSVDIVTVTDGTGNNPISVQTASPVSLGSDNHVELNGVQGVPGSVNRDWFITITGADTFTLNGSRELGFGSGTGGTAMWSQQTFQPMINIDTRPGAGQLVVNEVLGSWQWNENAIYVPGSTSPRQLWIEYIASTDAPLTGTIGLCQGREKQFLTYATAARFATGVRQMPVGPQYMMAAYGPSGQADGSGGMLRELLAPIWRQQQQLPRRPGLIRPRRGIAPVLG